MLIKIALGEANQFVLSSLSEIIEQDNRFSLVSTSNTVENFLKSVSRVPVDIAIIDWDLPILGGKNLVQLVSQHPTPPRIIAYGLVGDLKVQQALQVGAAAYCSRDCSVEELIEVCLKVAEGKMVFPYTDIRGIQTNTLASLTQRELDLLEVLVEGKTNRQVAHQFSISENTVKFHLSNIYEKINAKNRAHAVGIYLSLKDTI